MSYKKRARSGWEGGKGYKKKSNRSERMYENKEIRDELEEFNQGEEFRYKHKSKVTKNDKMRLESQISWYKRTIDRYRDRISTDGYFFGFVTSFKHTYEKLKQKWDEKYGNKDD